MPLRLIFALALAAVLLVGCATTADPNYNAYVKFVEAQQEAQQKRFASIASTADKCTTDSCVQQVAALAALAQAAGASQGASLQPYRKTYHPAWSILGATVPAVINGAVAWRQSEVNRDVQVAQYDWLGGMMRDLSNSSALQPPAAPNINVGGDYIPGSQHVGDTVGGDYITGHVGDAVGRDQIGGDQHVGDAIGRDVIGGDRIDNAGNIGNDNRIESPGPYESGDTCEGTACQGENNPPPVADGG